MVREEGAIEALRSGTYTMVLFKAAIIEQALAVLYGFTARIPLPVVVLLQELLDRA